MARFVKNMAIAVPARNERMRFVRSKNTRPEMVVRQLLHRTGYRYRLHGKALPGRPDLVFASRRKVIFVHGCFWHRHPRCRKASTPKSNELFWAAKFQANRLRDRRNNRQLLAAGWGVIIVWECELADPMKLQHRLARELDAIE